MTPISVLKRDLLFAKDHALKSAKLIQSLVDEIETDSTGGEVVNCLQNRQSSLTGEGDELSLEKGIINFYLYCFNKKSEEE